MIFLRAEGEKKEPSEITLAAAPIACASVSSDQSAFCRPFCRGGRSARAATNYPACAANLGIDCVIRALCRTARRLEQDNLPSLGAISLGHLPGQF